MDESNKLISPSVPFYYCHQSPPPDAPNVTILKTRFGDSCTSNNGLIPSYISEPFDDSGAPHGKDVKEYLVAKQEDGYSGAQKLITEVWGEEFASKLAGREDWVLCMESVYWYNIFMEGLNTGIVNIGTAKMVAEFQSQYASLSPYGSSPIKSYTNGKYALCAMVEPNAKLGIIYPIDRSDILSNETILAYGYGMIQAWPKDGDMIPTYNGKDSPGPPDDIPHGQANIVKSYHTLNKTTGEDTHDGTHSKQNVSNTILILDEPEYKVQAWKVTDTFNTNIKGTDAEWKPQGSMQPTNGNGNGPGSTIVNVPTYNTLYVQLVKETEDDEELIDGIDYYIDQSQVSKKVELGNALTNPTVKDKAIETYKFIWNTGTITGCTTSHEYTYTATRTVDVYDDEGNKTGTKEEEYEATGHTNCTWGKMDNNDMKVGLKVSSDSYDTFKDVLASTDNANWRENFKSRGKEIVELTSVKTNDKWNQSIEKEVDGFNLNMVIHRGKDKLTIYSRKNSNTVLKDITGETSMYQEGVKPANTRKTKDYTDSFDIKIEDNSTDLKTSAGYSESSHGKNCGATRHWGTGELVTELTVTPLAVYIHTYSGKSNGGFCNTECITEKMIDFTANNKYKTGRMVPTGTSFSFYPYIEMRYDTLTSQDQQVYVVGQYQRSMSPNDYAEVMWTRKPNDNNLTLSSRQWSTHALALSGAAWKGKDQVLPAGAVMNIGIKENDRQTVTVVTYQCILEGDGRTQVGECQTISDDYMSKGKAEAYHTAYVESVKAALDGLCVEQYATPKAYTSNSDIFKDNGSQVVKPNCRINNFDAKDKTTSTDDKYYFRHLDENTTSGKAQEGDLDVNVGSTSTESHVFSSDTKGNILMDGTAILSQEQDASSLSDPKAIEYNNRTLVVKKLIDAIERNTGDDSGAKNIAPHWYNEAFDGITVIKQTTVITTGMIDPSERTAVLDVKLAPANQGQSDLFSKAYTSQFKMADTSSADGYNDEKWHIGNFTNASNTSYSIYMKDMDYLYKSKKFYIPNANVQDLR